MSNLKFTNAYKAFAQNVPPVWMMRQAGRYHKHYQKLRAQHSFMELCKRPELAAEVAMGPIEDFDFDVSILFSDLLFPLEAMGMGLKYDPSPELGWKLTPDTLKKLIPAHKAIEALQFQGEAVQATRKLLPESKSLIGFVGGPWTLFTYAAEGEHKGSLTYAKSHFPLFHSFCESLVPLLIENIALQINAGAEIVMIFDTAAGELDPISYQQEIVPQLRTLINAHPGKIGYYSKGTQAAHLADDIFSSTDLAGLGVDHRYPLNKLLGVKGPKFYQGNFDQALLFCEPKEFEERFRNYLSLFSQLKPDQRKGWVCGLGHGVLPQTPEVNVRRFVQIVREVFS